MTIHVAIDTGCNMNCDYSAVEGSRVLMKDLNWKEIQEIEKGEEVVAFDRPEQTEKNKEGKLRVSPVTETWKYEKDAVRVTTDKGEVVVGETHPFLSKHHGFRDAKDFKPGQEIRHVVTPEDYEENDLYQRGYIHGALAGDGTLHSDNVSKFVSLRSQDEEMVRTVAEYSSPEYYIEYRGKNSEGLYEASVSKWKQVETIAREYPANEHLFDDKDYVRGWLAGIFDADGSIDGTCVRINQYPGVEKDLIIEGMELLGYDYVKEEKAIRLVGNRLAFLAEIRPKVSRKVESYAGHGWNGQAEVLSVEHVGKRTFYDVTVDTYHTLVLEGLCSHNCYEEENRDISGNNIQKQYDVDAIKERLLSFKEKYPNTTPGLHGGEPLLMDNDDIEEIYSFISEHWDGKSGIQTNASLIQDRHIDIFEENNVHVGISCDGPVELHKRVRGARGDNDDVDEAMAKRIHSNLERVIEHPNISTGVIVVLSKANAGTDEDLEKLLDWMDWLNRNNVTGHYNPAIPYDDIQTDISLSGERMKEVFVRTWEWMMEEEYRSWNPMRDYQDNLLGNSLGNCTKNKCFDPKTEILTRDGWKSVVDASLDDTLATLNRDTHELEWQEPLQKQAYHHEGEMVHFESNGYDLKVTPDHDMYVSSYRDSDFERESALVTEDRSSEARFIAGAEWSGERQETHTLEPASAKSSTGSLHNVEEVDMDTWLEFLGWYISEGSCGVYGVNNECRITISQKDSDARSEIVSLLRNLGFSPRENGHNVIVSSKQLYNELAPYGKAHEKFVPEYVKSLTSEQIELFLGTLWRGDGTESESRGKIVYYTTSEKLADDVQELLLKTGSVGRIRTDERSGPDNKWKPRYIVSAINNTTPHLCGDVKREEYSGYVYDFTVPNHTLYVRRNGKPTWTGNCDVFNAGAAKLVLGDGETSGCGKTFSAVGDGAAFLQGPSMDEEYNSTEERYEMLKQTPSPFSEEEDQGGCKGCKYWNVCRGGCPSAGKEDDYRNRTRWCPAIYGLYEAIESDMRSMFPNLTMITDYPWNAKLGDSASSWQLDIKPFAGMHPGDGRPASIFGKAEHDWGTPKQRVPEEIMPEQTNEEKIQEYYDEYGEENVSHHEDGSDLYVHADSDKGWMKKEEEDDS